MLGARIFLKILEVRIVGVRKEGALRLHGVKLAATAGVLVGLHLKIFDGLADVTLNNVRRVLRREHGLLRGVLIHVADFYFCFKIHFIYIAHGHLDFGCKCVLAVIHILH